MMLRVTSSENPVKLAAQYGNNFIEFCSMPRLIRKSQFLETNISDEYLYFITLYFITFYFYHKKKNNAHN